MGSSFFLKFYSQFKHYFCKHWIIFVCYCIAGKKCMDTEFFGSFCFQCAERFKDLICCHSVFGIPRIIHNIITDFKQSTRIITAADCLRDVADSLFYCFNMCNIIKIDNSTDLICIAEFCFRRIIGWKHDITFFAADCFGKHQFGHRGTVTSTSVLLKDLDQIWIRCCFNCEEFFESFIPCKGFF